MKILHMANTDYFLYHLLRHKLLGLQAFGHEVHVAAPAGRYYAALEHLGFRVHALPIPCHVSPLRDYSAFRAARRLLMREGFDIVHTHSVKTYFLSLAARRLDTRAVHTRHGFALEEQDIFLKGLYHAAARFAALRPHLLLAQSREALDALRSFGAHCLYEGDGIDLDGLNDAVRLTRTEPVRKNLCLHEDDVAVAFFAQFEPGNGHLPFIEAFTQASTANLRLACFFVGAPSRENRYAAKIASSLAASPAQAHMHMLSPREDTHSLLRAMNFLVLSPREEARAVIQAMALGLPVIAFDAPGVRELVIHGVTGLLVPHGDTGALTRAIDALASDPMLRLRMGFAAHARVKTHFDEKLVIDRIRAAYASIQVKPR